MTSDPAALDAPPEEVEPDVYVRDHRFLSRQAQAHRLEHAGDFAPERVSSPEYAWSKRQTNQVRRTLKILQLVFPGANLRFRASDILAMRRYDDGSNFRSTIEVLEDAGLLIDDRVSSFDKLFERKTGALPEPMRSQLELWRDIMVNGSKTSPRRQPRDAMTVKGQMYGILPAIHRWVEQGRTSLTGIGTEDVLAVLLEEPSPRHTMMLGFRTLFPILRGRKQIFADPTKTIPLHPVKRNLPLPMEPTAIRDALTNSDPVIALAVSLVAFHALTTAQVQHIQLTDIIDGRLRMLDGRIIPLAKPVRVRLTAWLDRRAKRWPETKNPLPARHRPDRASALTARTELSLEEGRRHRSSTTHRQDSLRSRANRRRRPEVPHLKVSVKTVLVSHGI